MGSSQSSLQKSATVINYQSLLSTFNVSAMQYNDSFYGEVDVYENAEGCLLTIKQQQCRDMSDMQAKFKKMEIRQQKILHTNVIQLHGVGIRAVSQFCSSAYSVLLCLDYIRGSVQDEMRLLSERYSDEDIWRIFESVVGGMSFFEENNLENKCIRLENIKIVIAPNKQKLYKIFDNALMSGASLMLQLLINLQSDAPNMALIYLSPEELIELSSHQPPSKKSTSYQSDMFSLGINLIHMLTWQSCEDIYDWNTVTLDRQKLVEKLAMVQARNHTFYEIITSMINFNPEERPTFKTLDAYLNQLPVLAGQRSSQIIPVPNLNLIYASQSYVQPNSVFQPQAVVTYEEQGRVENFQPVNNNTNAQRRNYSANPVSGNATNIFGGAVQQNQQQLLQQKDGGGIFGNSNKQNNGAVLNRGYTSNFNSNGNFQNGNNNSPSFAYGNSNSNANLNITPFNGVGVVGQGYPSNSNNNNNLMSNSTNNLNGSFHGSPGTNAYNSLSPFPVNNFGNPMNNAGVSPNLFMNNSPQTQNGLYNSAYVSPYQQGYNGNPNMMLNVNAYGYPQNNSNNNSFALPNNNMNNVNRNASFEINSYGNTQKLYGGGGLNEFEYYGGGLGGGGYPNGNMFNFNEEALSNYSNARAFVDQRFFGALNNGIGGSGGGVVMGNLYAEQAKKMQELQIIQSNSKLRAEVDYQNGSHYNGDLLSNGMRHGYGVFKFADGSQYEGNWYLNQMSGLGTLYYSNGKIAYEGGWSQSKFNGYGKIYMDRALKKDAQIDYTDLTKYNEFMVEFHGEFILDQKEGFGTLILANGDICKGIFENDKLHGGGVYQIKNGEAISAVWNAGQIHQKYD